MDGTCDFAKDIAFLYPLRVIMQILGVPESDEPRMLKLTQELFGTSDPEMNRSGASPLDSNELLMSLLATVQDFTNYFDAITADRRANPRDDVASVIANSKIDGELLTQRGAMGYYIIVATAGHDTTSNTTAGGMWALAENPDRIRQAQGRPEPDPVLCRGDDPLGHAGQALHAQCHGRHRGPWPEDREGRLADAVLPLGQSRRGGL